jgi:hypothetical protein
VRNPFEDCNIAVLLMALLFILVLVAEVRVPADDIPDLIRAVGTWWHIDLRI